MSEIGVEGFTGIPRMTHFQRARDAFQREDAFRATKPRRAPVSRVESSFTRCVLAETLPPAMPTANVRAATGRNTGRILRSVFCFFQSLLELASLSKRDYAFALHFSQSFLQNL